MVYIFLADGFEEIEALTAVDVLRRAKIQTATVSVTGEPVTGSHGIKVHADIPADKIEIDDRMEGLILPGGMPGTTNLLKSGAVKEAVAFAEKKGILMAAICAAPSVLGQWGVLRGRKATCFPGFENELAGAVLCTDSVCTDGNIITAKGAGVSLPFALAIVAFFCGSETAKKLAEDMQCPR